MPGRIGLPEILLILAIVILLFGGKKIPEIGRGLGEGIRNFKDALKGAMESKPAESKPEEKK